jgi:hypothetical protein
MPNNQIQKLARFENMSSNPYAEPLTDDEIAIFTALVNDRQPEETQTDAVKREPKPAPEPEQVDKLVKLVTRMVEPLADVEDKPKSTLTVASWNIRYFSTYKATHLSEAIAEVQKKVDLISIQEANGTSLRLLSGKSGWPALMVRGSNRYQRCGLLLRPGVFETVGKTHAIESVTNLDRLSILHDGLRPFLVQTLKHVFTNEYFSAMNMHPKSNVAGLGIDETLAFLINGKARYQQLMAFACELEELQNRSLIAKKQIILADTNCPLRTALEIEPLIKEGFFLQNPDFAGASHRLGDWFDGCFLKGIPADWIGQNFIPELWSKKEDIQFVETEEGFKKAVFNEDQELFLMLSDHVPDIQEIHIS